MLVSALSSTHSPDHVERRAVVRRDLRPNDVDVRVDYCGVCSSDLHALDAAAGSDSVVPGHEFVGEVVRVGTEVTDFAAGDLVAVGNIVDSCGRCRSCRQGQENFCEEFPTLTYGGRDRIDGTVTDGGWSRRYIVRDHFVYHRPANLAPAAVAPLMCAGITVWEPLRSAGVGPGTRLGVVGIGGLGHLAVRLGRTLGAEVTVFTTSASKADDARRLGASSVVVSGDDAALEAARGTLDVVIDTVSVNHDIRPHLAALDLDGTYFVVGFLGAMTVSMTDLLIGRKRLASAGSGGHRWTQDLLDFCGEHDVAADVEVLPSSEIDTALRRLRANDVRYRFVLDLADLDAE